ncbi:uncharacterized protein LOC115632412 [Scaptodrosophila lebanonensis]|uniref:Uncharacterized protein LOC115632412 n=1 Tax=Drosophila lebanonensis TaxID=7225 RepID=A0A6J2UE94_DROLE|nr:uncharacterized protein LOC115632412 [Scaptodrosophila lebanonensis]
MPTSSGILNIKHGRVLGNVQKTWALIFVSYLATCGYPAVATATTITATASGTTTTTTTTTSSLASSESAQTAGVGKHATSEKLQRHINQNLIMSPVASFAAASAAALTADDGEVEVESYARTGSRSSITSFDSNHLIDDRRQQHQHQQQHHQQEQQQQQHPHPHEQQQPHSRIQAKDTAGPYPIPAHRPESADNHLDGGSGGVAGTDNVFGTPMYFGTENSTVVTTQIGATAHVPCTVHHIGEGVVSWIRKKDYHLLTVGLTTYSSDERFSATHLKHSEDWTLQIKFVQLRDAGVYECQVSTHPPTSIFLHLSVVEARAEISGPPIRYLTPGSTLRLQCRVVQNTEASEYIFWYHDNRMINYDIDRGINVSTDPDFQSSELTILRTRREHSGNFTCVASNTQPASVLVHIFKGDNPAAMYHGHVGGSTKTAQSQLHIFVVIIAIGYRIFHTSIYMKIV